MTASSACSASLRVPGGRSGRALDWSAGARLPRSGPPRSATRPQQPGDEPAERARAEQLQELSSGCSCGCARHVHQTSARRGPSNAAACCTPKATRLPGTPGRSGWVGDSSVTRFDVNPFSQVHGWADHPQLHSPPLAPAAHEGARSDASRQESRARSRRDWDHPAPPTRTASVMPVTWCRNRSGMPSRTHNPVLLGKIGFNAATMMKPASSDGP